MAGDSKTRRELTDTLIDQSERLLQEAKDLQTLSVEIERQIKKRGSVVEKPDVLLTRQAKKHAVKPEWQK